MRARGGFVQVKFKTWVRNWPDWGPGPPSLRLLFPPSMPCPLPSPLALSLSTVAQGVAAYSDHIIKENFMLKKRYIHNAAGGRLKQRHIFVAVWYFFPHTTTDSDASGVVPACLPACQYSVHSVDEKEMKGAGRPWEGPSVGGGCCVQWAIFL